MTMKIETQVYDDEYSNEIVEITLPFIPQPDNRCIKIMPTKDKWVEAWLTTHMADLVDGGCPLPNTIHKCPIGQLGGLRKICVERENYNTFSALCKIYKIEVEKDEVDGIYYWKIYLKVEGGEEEEPF